MSNNGRIQGGADTYIPKVLPGSRTQFCKDDYDFTKEAGTLFNAAVLPASGAWQRSQMFNVRVCRFVTLELRYLAAASATAPYPLIVPMYCSQETQPAINDDVWVPFSTSDGSVTATTLSGTLPTTGTGGWKGFTNTSGQLFGYQTYLPLVIVPQKATTAADVVEQGFVFDVTHAHWFCFMAAEKGDTTHPGTVDAYISGGC